MPKNQTGGSSHKRRKNAPSQKIDRKVTNIARNADDNQVYGKVEKALGACRFSVLCQDLLEPKNPDKYSKINCKLKGSIKKRISAGDVVLVQLWQINEANEIKGTIVDSYKEHEISALTRMGLFDFSVNPDADEADVGIDTDMNDDEISDKQEPDSFTVSHNQLSGPIVNTNDYSFSDDIDNI